MWESGEDFSTDQFCFGCNLGRLPVLTS